MERTEHLLTIILITYNLMVSMRVNVGIADYISHGIVLCKLTKGPASGVLLAVGYFGWRAFKVKVIVLVLLAAMMVRSLS